MGNNTLPQLGLLALFTMATACEHQAEHHRPSHSDSRANSHHGGHHAHKGGGAEQTFVPFESVDEYIAHLDKEERTAWQKPDQVVAWLGLTGSETLVDVGAGSGYFTFRLGRVLPQGSVVAADIEPKMLDHIRAQVHKAKLENVNTVLSLPNDPKLPIAVDVVFLCNVFHHIADRKAWLGNALDQMGAGSRLVMVEFKPDSPIGPPENIRIPAKALEAELTGAGFELKRIDSDLLPYQYLAEFVRP